MVIKQHSYRHTTGILALVFLLLALAYSCVVPSFEAPDEVGHFAYVTHLLRTHRLPVQRVGDLGESHQPPLYYALAALFAAPADLDDPTGTFRLNPAFIWAGQGGADLNAGVHGSAETFPFRGQALALHLARASSALMGAVTVAFTVLIAMRVFPDDPASGLLAGILVALNPQFLFSSGTVNNDSMLTMVSTVALWQVLRAAARPEQWRGWAMVGALVGLGFLAKINGGLVIGLVAGVALLLAALEHRSYRLLVRGALAVGAVTILVSGWWFVRNQILYGDPVGLEVYRQVFAANLRYAPLRWSSLKDFFSVQFRSFWGVFGWMNVTSPAWFYRLFGTLCLLGLAGWVVRAVRQRGSGQSRPHWASTAPILLVTALLAQEVYMLGVITQCNDSCYQGRYLFPAIAPLMIVLSRGLTGLVAPRRTWAAALTAVTAVGLGALAVFVPVRIIDPAYGIVPVPTWRLWTARHQVDLTFGGMLRLRGYDVRMNRRAATVTLTLYWQALQTPDFDYSVFAHLVDGSDQLIAQKDHAPGEAEAYPPTAWQSGDVIVDTHTLEVPRPLPPDGCRFRIGAYNWVTGERLPALSGSDPVGDFAYLDCPM